MMMPSLAFVALNALPIFSAHCGGSESCTLMVRGYNLLEFSSWAALPVFTVVIILGILFSFQKKSAKNVELLLLLLANAVCCLESMKAARTWLEGISNAPVNSHFGMVAFPLGIMAIIFYAILYVNNFRNFSNSNR
jgi:D-alanyl-lipoteichoic acid acyltransferase DltB (MBOAT superfamily)